jgi:hypothetical protein
MLAAIHGPCVRHLELSLGLRALVQADGGSLYGTGPKGYGNLPVWYLDDGGGLTEGPGGTGGYLSDSALSGMRSALDEAVCALPPSATLATPCGLLLRGAQLGVRSVRGRAAVAGAPAEQRGAVGSAAGGSTGGEGTLQVPAATAAGGAGGAGVLLLQPWHALAAAMDCLTDLRQLLLRSPPSEQRDRDEVDWWRCAGELALALCRCGAEQRALVMRERKEVAAGLADAGVVKLLLGEQLLSSCGLFADVGG